MVIRIPRIWPFYLLFGRPIQVEKQIIKVEETSLKKSADAAATMSALAEQMGVEQQKKVYHDTRAGIAAEMKIAAQKMAELDAQNANL